DRRVLGVVAQRGRLLPLVSLRTLLGAPSEEFGARHRVAVVRLDATTSLGLVADRSGEILRVPVSLVHPVPPLLARGGRQLEVGAICRLEDGRRLVSVLSPENLFRHDAVREAIALGGDGEEEEKTMAEPAAQDEDEQEEFVVFRLAGEEYGVPIGQVDEVLRLPEEPTRVPRAPDFLEGVMNLRGT